MSGTKKRNVQDLLLCPLPVETINRTLGTELVPGDVIIRRTAQHHVQKKHADDYRLFLAHLPAILTHPRYIGDDLANRGIEIWGYVAIHKQLVLVAVEITPDENGDYDVLSFYRVSETKAQSRRQRGYLKVPKA